MWWSISIAARATPSAASSRPAFLSCMAKKLSGTTRSLTKRSANRSGAPRQHARCKQFSSNGQRPRAARKQGKRMSSNGAKAAFKDHGHIVIVGASLAGLRAAETLRAEGFTGPLTLIGDEPYLPYDRPPLSKSVLTGWIPADHTQLPRRNTLSDAEWRLGVAATSLDVPGKRVRLADGKTVSFDRLLIATGTRARPWPNKAEAALKGVFTIRGRDD